MQDPASNLNWDDGRLFLAVARNGQLLAAARTLGLSQATLSRRMTALERSIGARLLIRRTTGCELTEAGRELAAALEKVERQFIASQGRLAGREASLSGTVRIGAPDGFGVGFVAPRLGQLSAQHPDLDIQLVPVSRAFSLSQREADIAVMVERPTEGRLVARKLADYSLSLYASATYLAAYGTPTEASELGRHRLIGYVEDLLYSPVLDYAGEIWRGWRNRLEISSALGQLHAVAAGAGIAILHDYLAAEHPALQRLLPDLSIERSYWTVYHESMRDNARVRACADFLAAAVRAEGPVQPAQLNRARRMRP